MVSGKNCGDKFDYESPTSLHNFYNRIFKIKHVSTYGKDKTKKRCLRPAGGEANNDVRLVVSDKCDSTFMTTADSGSKEGQVCSTADDCNFDEYCEHPFQEVERGEPNFFRLDYWKPKTCNKLEPWNVKNFH